MATEQIIILTIMAVVAFATLCSLIWRMAKLDDNLWIEPVILIVLALLAYLVAR